LRGVATAMADISDGLLGDLGHILKASHVGAEIDLMATADLMAASAHWTCPADFASHCVLSGGDDYELVFTAPAEARSLVLAAAAHAHTRVTRIGQITPAPGLVLHDAHGLPVQHHHRSFDHFA
jgi:thiamine-monophosphate kinase